MDYSVPKNKPKGMNTAVPHCRGDMVGVFDPRTRSTRSWSLRHCMEYYFWFRSWLHFHANALHPLDGPRSSLIH